MAGRLTGLGLFLREILSHPRRMGAVCPSSPCLAAQLIRPIPNPIDGFIVELGAGTGIVTHALMQQHDPKNIVVIEQSARLVCHLQKQFPQLRVYQGDAQHASELLQAVVRPVRVIISSLPLRSLSPAVVAQVGAEVEKLLSPGGLFIQYTYRLWGDPGSVSSRLDQVACYRVWRNLPPARVLVFRCPLS